METDKTLFRKPHTISSLDDLETAKKRAEINVSQDRLRLQNNLQEIKREGPSILLKNVVLPVVAIGFGIYGITKIVGSLTKNKNREYYYEPNFEDDTEYTPHTQAPVHAKRLTQAPSQRSKVSLLSDFAKYGPILLKVSQLGVNYLEKNGTQVPSLVHDLLAKVGSPEQKGTSKN